MQPEPNSGGREPDSVSHAGLIVLAVAAAAYLGCVLSPPSLMDDVDAVQAQIARNMLESGDYVIAQLDGVPYIEKSPLIYWLIAGSYRIFGVHDWSARVPVAVAAILLAWVTFRFAAWAFGERSGFYAGLVMSSSVGMFLFTRIQIPDVMLTLCVAIAFWSFAHCLDPDEPHQSRWAALLALSFGTGLLFKGLIAVVLPLGGILAYMVISRQLFSASVWSRLHPLRGLGIILVVALPWHLAAMRRMPPIFDFTMHSGPGEYHGFFWFYFINEHLLRFLNLRYPRDYNTVPRLAFWLLNLVWLFPWSAYLPATFRATFRPVDRASRARLLALTWALFLLAFFSFSTTQEYYSMPLYPALALLIGSGLAEESRLAQAGRLGLSLALSIAAAACLAILYAVRRVPTPGDISAALQQNPDAYSLSMGHIGDLTLASFAYLRLPLALAAISFLAGAAALWWLRSWRSALGLALAMVALFQASRIALESFDPYLGSRPLAEALLHSADGQIIFNSPYYDFSSVVFYTNRRVWLLNGRKYNLEYGSYAPGVNNPFLDDSGFLSLWMGRDRCYVVTDIAKLEELRKLAGPDRFYLMTEAGGKAVYTNFHPRPSP